MLKRYQYFFIALFLVSMLFTVFQYIPILEEEIHASKTMSKKNNATSGEKDAADDDAGDDEGDEDDTDEFFSHSNNNKFLLLTSNSKFNTFRESHFNSVFSISTPPPKLV